MSLVVEQQLIYFFIGARECAPPCPVYERCGTVETHCHTEYNLCCAVAVVAVVGSDSILKPESQQRKRCLVWWRPSCGTYLPRFPWATTTTTKVRRDEGGCTKAMAGTVWFVAWLVEAGLVEGFQRWR